MRLHHGAVLALLIAVARGVAGPVLLTAQDNFGTYEDRIAVENLMARYVWTVDSLDADGWPCSPIQSRKLTVFTD